MEPRYFYDDVIIQVVDEAFSGRALLRILMKKLLRGLGGNRNRLEPIVFSNGLVVFSHANLHGGGLTFGQDFCRVLLELGMKRCERIFEFCAGPGYIGYSLLANGFCGHLTLADINPAAIDAAKHTAKYNNIEHLVNIYLSDGLSQIPEREKWDLAVGNPPHFMPGGQNDEDIRRFDPDWSIHRRFYLSVKRFMKPGGHVLLVENCCGSRPEFFEAMIREGGGELVTTRTGTNLSGSKTGFYYVVSKW